MREFAKNPRYAKLFFENLDGHSVFVCKFIKPQKPPPEVFDNQIDNVKAIEKAARFVSLIPYVEDS